MALGLTQPLVKMSTRHVLGGKGGRCVRLTTYHHIVPMSRNLGTLALLDPSGPAWPVMGVLLQEFVLPVLRLGRIPIALEKRLRIFEDKILEHKHVMIIINIKINTLK
jgi:hypothetical protein